MKRKAICKAIIALAVAMAFVMPVAAFANVGTIGVTSDSENTIDIKNMVSNDAISCSSCSTLPAPDYNLYWTYTTGNRVYGSPIVDHGRVFIGSNDKNMYCLDAFTGEKIWNYTTGGQIHSRPALWDEKIYTGSGHPDTNLYCLNAATGEELWNFTTGGTVSSSPAIDHGRVYFGSHDDKVYCVDALTGAEIWNYTTGGMVCQSSPAIDSEKLYVGCWDGNLYCLNANTGDFLWTYPTNNNLICSPTVDHGRVFFGSNDDYFYCVDSTTGNLIWSHDGGGWIQTKPVIDHEMVFFGAGNTLDLSLKVLCRNAGNGDEIWTRIIDHDWGKMALGVGATVCNGKLYLGIGSSLSQHPEGIYHLYCFDAQSGTTNWLFPTGGGVRSIPSIVWPDEYIYFGSADRNVYCLGPPLDHDVGVTSINSPVSGRTGIFTPEVTIENYGLENEINVPVNMQITKIESFGLEYNETVYVNIDSEEIKTVTFPDWVPDDLPTFSSIDYEIMSCTQLEGDEKASNDCKTVKITLLYLHDVGVESITQPSSPDGSLDSEWLYFHTGWSGEGVGLTHGGTFEGAIRLTPDELGDYDAWELNSVRWCHYERGTHSGNIKIYEAGTSTEPGDLITSEPYTVTGDGWKEIPLSEAVTINASEDIWVSVEVTHNEREFPIGIDAGPAIDGKGDWIYYGGWEELQPGLDYNWCIEAKVEEVSAFTLPPGEYPVEGIVKNYGIYTETDFNVNATIWLIEDKNTLFYTDNSMVTTTMNPGDTLPVAFDNVIFLNTDGGEYRLDITTELVGDEYPENDQRHILFTVVAPDTTPPVTTHDFDGTMGENNWYVSDVTVTLTATDDISGVNYTMYSVDRGEWYQYVDPFVVSDNGEHIVWFYSVDFAGNVEDTNEANLKIDQTPPVTTYELEGDGSITVTLTAIDEISGVAYTMYKLNGGTYSEYVEPILVDEEGEHTVCFYSVDNAGNEEDEKSCTFTVTAELTVEISGGLGVTATIKNVGDVDAAGVEWSITLDGGLIIIGKEKTGTVDILAGDEAVVKSFILGIGKTVITVAANDIGETADGFVLLFFVLGV